MAHHLNYIELAWYVGTGLGSFKMLSRFAIQMIAIFARDKFSARAFKVLALGQRGHRAAIFRSRTSDNPRSALRELEARGAPRARANQPVVVTPGQRRTRTTGRR